MFKIIFCFLVMGTHLTAMDIIITNAAVHTVDPDYSGIEAVAVKDHRIAAVGLDKDILKLAAPTTLIVDAQRKLLLPGFNDAHLHFLSGGRSLLELDLSGCTTWEQIKQKVLTAVQETVEGEWITGRGWDHTLFNRGRWPNKTMLDKIAPAHPVFLRRIDGHVGWANSLALKRCGITKDTSEPEGGEILLDSLTGCPTGIFKESAMDIITEYIPEHGLEEDRAAIRKALEEAARLGVTSIQDNSGIESLLLYREFYKRGELNVRVSEWLDFESARDPERLSQIKNRYQEAICEHYIRLGLVKGFVDGTLGSRTASLFEPYCDQPGEVGLLQYTQNDLDQLVLTADRLGFQVGLHCIGDKASYMAINAYEKAFHENNTRDHRHRIEHAQVLRRDDLERMAKLGVIASMQPTHCTSDLRWAEQRLGLERCRLAYAWKDILTAEGNLAFGTDWPVEPLDPMRGLYSAVTRRHIDTAEPENGWISGQCLSLEEAIYAYTMGSAYAEFQEQEKGSITPGKLADMVLLSQNLFTISPRAILETRVEMTIYDGKIIYSRQSEKD